MLKKKNLIIVTLVILCVIALILIFNAEDNTSQSIHIRIEDENTLIYNKKQISYSDLGKIFNREARKYGMEVCLVLDIDSKLEISVLLSFLKKAHDFSVTVFSFKEDPENLGFNLPAPGPGSNFILQIDRDKIAISDKLVHYKEKYKMLKYSFDDMEIELKKRLAALPEYRRTYADITIFPSKQTSIDRFKEVVSICNKIGFRQKDCAYWDPRPNNREKEKSD